MLEFVKGLELAITCKLITKEEAQQQLKKWLDREFFDPREEGEK